LAVERAKTSSPSPLRGGKFAERSEGKQGGGKWRHPTRLLAFKSALADLNVYKIPISDKSEMGARSHPPRQGEGEDASALGAMSRIKSLRLVSNILSLTKFCDRATCKRAKKCKGDAARCLALYAEYVPREAREFVVDLIVSRELGYSFEEAMRRDKEGARAFSVYSVIPGRE
jgi:hypothetical protein